MGNGPNAERDAAAVEADCHHQAPPGHCTGRKGQRGIECDEINYRIEQRQLVAGVKRPVGAHGHRGGPLVGCSVEGVDLGVGQQLEVAQRELPDPTGADDQHPALPSRTAQRLQSLLHRPVAGEAPAGQRRASHRVEIAQRVEVGPVGDGHALGVAPVHHQAGLGGIGADHLVSVSALPASPAPPRRIHHHRPQFGVFPGDLVAQHDGQRARELAGHHVQVGVAQPAGNDVDDLAAVGTGFGVVIHHHQG